MGRGIEFYKSTFLTFLVMGFGTILIVGLISGFAGRTPDCSKTTDKPAQSSTTSAVPTTKPTIGTNATSPTTRTSPTTSSSSPSTSSPSTPSTSSSSSTQSLPLIKHNAVLSSLANLSPRSRGILPGTKVDVTALETAASNYFRNKYQAQGFFYSWTTSLTGGYQMNVRFTFYMPQLTYVDTLINDFLNGGYNEIFLYEVLPDGYAPSLNTFESIAKNSYVTTSDFTIDVSSTTASTMQPSTTSRPSESDYRLPKTIEPTNYELTLKAFYNPYSNSSSASLNTEYFEGSVKIALSVKNTTNSIVLHVDPSIKILDQIKVGDQLNAELESVANLSSNYRQNQLYQIDLKNNLTAGKGYYLTMNFYRQFGSLSTLNGFYRSRYNEEGVIKTVLATNFEPTDARKAFPCFDEPSLKATYDIIIEHPSDTIALSNWPVKVETPIDSNRLRTEFDTTYKMSTYLAAWVITPDDFDYVNGFTKNGKEVRVYGRKLAKKNDLLDFALEAARLTIDFFENDYFKIPDALPPKIDLVGLPEFPAGAMEHWGVIGFRESRLFYTSKDNSVINKQRVALIVAHELAHFWFGNYATCSWWDDLWLNEAMASFLEYKAINAVYPDMGVRNQHIVDRLMPVMYDDGYDYSQTVAASNIVTPDEINQLFSSFTYDKGSSLLIMLEATVGEDKFRDGLIKYLNKNAYGSGVGADFYNSLDMPQELIDANVNGEEFVRNFIEQINYPLVSVNLTYDNGETVVSLNQKRFLHSIRKIDMAEISSTRNYTWKLYLQCKAGGTYNPADPNDLNQHLLGSNDEYNFYLGDKSATFRLSKRQYSWIKCNKDFHGYYLTNYAESNFQALEHVMQSANNVLSIGDRAHLLHSAYALSFADILSYSVPNYLSSYMELKEVDYVPWKVYFWHLTKLASILEHRASFKDLRASSVLTAKGLTLNSNFADLWDNSGTHTELLLKINAIEFLCRFQDESCLNKATELFKTVPQNFFSSPNNQTNPLPPNYRAQVYKYHMQNTNEYFEWFWLQDYYFNTADPQESFNALSGLTFQRSTWLLDALLKELLNSNNRIKPQDTYDLMSLVGDNPVGRYQVWMFVRHNYKDIITRYGNTKGFARSIKRICETFDNVFLYAEMKDFFDRTEPGAGFFIRLQTEDIVLNNIFWVEAKENDIFINFFVPDK